MRWLVIWCIGSLAAGFIHHFFDDINYPTLATLAVFICGAISQHYAEKWENKI